MTNRTHLVAQEGGLSGAYIPMAEERANLILKENYGISATLKRFETEKDDTFRVTTAMGQKYVLKVANPEESLEEIDFQHSILSYVKSRDPTVPIPHAINCAAGPDIFHITDIDGSLRYVRMLSYLDGVPLDKTHSNPHERFQIGKVLARLRHATEGFSHIAENRYCAWDVQHLLTLEHLLEEVDDPTHQMALSQGLKRFCQVADKLKKCRKQVLHNDFSKSNIVVDHHSADFVTGIIDFGDAVKTAIAIDVATALLNQLPETPNEDLFYRAHDVIEGYLSIAELTDDELSLIPHLVMGRIITRALLTLWRAKLFPGNERYIMRNTEQGWHQLNWFLARSSEQVSDILEPYSKSRGSIR